MLPVFFRPHLPERCYQLGYMLNGERHRTGDGTCPSGPPPTGVWFDASVQVTANSATISLNGEVVVTTTPYYPPLAATGVLTWNGFENIISYRNCKFV